MGSGRDAVLIRGRAVLSFGSRLMAVALIAHLGGIAEAKPGSRDRRQGAARPAPDGSTRTSAPAPAPIDPSIGRRGIVLEIYPRERTAGAEAVIGPIVAALGMRGYATGPGQVGIAIAARLSRPARVVDHLDADTLARDIESGYRAYLVGQFEEAVEVLAAATAAAHQNPSAVALDQTLATSVQRALLGLTQALRRLGRDAEAFEVMAEHVRSFPDAAVNGRQYSPEIREFRQAVELELTRQGRGELRVEVDRPEAIVFVNEIFRGQGRVEIANLLPGLYRVFVQVGREDGRAYDVSVVPGRTTRLAVDWRFDASLETPPAWTGLVLRERKDWQTRAADYAGRIGRAVGAPMVILVGPDWDGIGLVGTVVASADGHVVRRAIARQRTADAKAQLTRFLAGESSDGVEVLIAETPAATGLPDAPPTADTSRPGIWRRRLAWASAAGAAAALVTSGVGLSIHGSCREEKPAGVECRELYDTRRLGIASGVAGLALAGVGLYLFVSDDEETPARGAGIRPRAGGVEAFVRVEF